MRGAERCDRLIFSPIKRWSQVEPQAVRRGLQQTMSQWGKPERLRMENGSRWGNFNRRPCALALWRVGLGITPRYGRPAHSSHHGVVAQWIELDACVDFDDGQQRLVWAVWRQRERYPSPPDYPRAHAFPALYTNPPSYPPQQDEPQWNCQRVAD